LTLAVAGKRVFYHDGESIVCLDRAAGERLWRSEPISRRTFLRSFFAPTLVVANGVVLFSGGSVKASDTGGGTNPLFALSAETGEILWQAEHPPSGYKSPEDIFVIDETVWFGATTSGGFEGGFTGYDLKTGELKNEFTPDVQTYWFHHRCYRGKATENYLLMSRTGIEFIDFRDPSWEIHHWVRGACLYGIMPANGLLYAPQHPCACYLEAKLYGMNALAPSASRSELPDIPEQERLQRGPAYDAPETVEKVNPAVDWPTYRHDARRSAFFPQPLAPELNTQWQTGLGGRLTAPVIAGGRLYVAQKDQHRLWALDAETGERLWSFQTGGRIDSPPTIHRGRALLGCRDGYVYCLDTRTGRLAWRYLAAPATYRMGYFEQLESVWPIHGSVLVENDTLYCIAGRSVFLDGGMWLVMLDPMTGELQGKRNFDQVNPETGENLQDTVDWLNMATGMSDILSSDGETIYLRSQPIDLQGRRKEVNYEDRTSAEGGRSHLFSPTGFLDDSYWHRTYWIYGQGFFSGWSGYYLAGQRNPSGRLLAFDEDRVFGFGREPQYFRWTTPIEYRLFAAEKEPEIVPQKPPRKNQNAKYRGKPVADPAVEFTTDWSKRIGLYVRGILLTGSDGSAETFFVAGPPDMLDEDEAGKTLDTPETREKQEKLGESLRGRLGASLLAVSAETGEPLSRIPLQAPPVWDGLAAAAGKIFLVDEDGEITCFAPEAPQSGSR
jgi:outer membrane protein assembly factor BamB